MVSKVLKVVIISKDSIAYEGIADAVLLPTSTGTIEILPSHVQLISALSGGDITLKIGKEIKIIKISGGVVEVRSKSNVIILVDIVKE